MQVKSFKLGTKDFYVVATYTTKKNADEDEQVLKTNDAPKDGLLEECRQVAFCERALFGIPEAVEVGLDVITFYNSENEETAESSVELSIKLAGTNKYAKMHLPRVKRKLHVKAGTSEPDDGPHNTLQEHVDKLEDLIEAYITGDRLQREIPPKEETPAAAPQKNLFGFPKKK